MGARKSVKDGVNYLEAWSKTRAGELPRYYFKQLGAMPVGYIPFDRQYADPAWDYEKDGEPGVVQMEIPKEGLSDLDRWFSLKHADDPLKNAEFLERLRHYKREAGVPVDELDEGHKPKKKFCFSGRPATPEQIAKMNHLADEAERLHFEFGVGGEPQIEAESTQESKNGGKCLPDSSQ